MKRIYAIRDRISDDLAGMFPLVTMRTDAQAIRYFGDSIATEKTALSAHPQDYELLYLGLVEDDGEIRPVPPSIVITGQTLLDMIDNQKQVEYDNLTLKRGEK